jgi:hypothetical protein
MTKRKRRKSWRFDDWQFGVAGADRGDWERGFALKYHGNADCAALWFWA